MLLGKKNGKLPDRATSEPTIMIRAKIKGSNLYGPRVLMVILGFHPHVGGAERQALLLANTLIKQGSRVDVVTMRLPGTASKEEIEGVGIFRVGLGSGISLLLSALIGIFWFIMSRSSQYSVIHVHQALLAALPAVLAARLTRLPVAIKVGNSGEKFDLSILAARYPFGKIIRKILIQLTDLYVAISDEIAEQLRSAGVHTEKIIRIPNGVAIPPVSDIDKTESRQSLGIDSEKFVLVCSARLVETKNHHLLLEIAQLLDSQRFQILILGDGPLREQLINRAKELGIEQSMNFLGLIQDVRKYLVAADAFVLCSLNEGMSNAVIEAMSFGLPVIVSDIPANRFVSAAAQKAGYLCDLSSKDEWVKTIHRLYANPDEKSTIGTNARQLAITNFSITKISERYRSMYAQMCDV